MDLQQFQHEQANDFYEQLANPGNQLLTGWEEEPLPKTGGIPHGPSGFSFSNENALSLLGSAQENGYTSPLWMTYEQAKRAGGTVKKGEKATKITAFAKTQDGYKPFLMNLFNKDQINGITKDPVLPAMTNKELDKLLSNMGVAVSHDKGSIPHYDAQKSQVVLPPKSYYTKNGLGSKRYYADIVRQTICNEFQTDASPGSQEHAKARLRQELACMWGMARLGLPNPEQPEKEWAKVYHDAKPGFRELDDAVRDAEQGLKQLNIERPVYQPLVLQPLNNEIKPTAEPNKTLQSTRDLQNEYQKQQEEEIPF